MRRNKKLWAVMLSLLVVLTMTIPAFAENNGKITINNAAERQKYSIYRILELNGNTLNAGEDTYDYTVAAEWKNFFENGAGKDYVTIGTDDSVTWNPDKRSDSDIAEFAQLALQYAKANNISATQTKTAGPSEVSNTLAFENLDLGYYLIDSSIGALCTLTTTAPNATVIDKNGEPTVDKEVQDGEGQWGNQNTAQIGDTVNFKVTITAAAGAENYILHEKMGEGLTYTSGSVQVTKNGEDVNIGYTVAENVAHGNDTCTFEVRFSKEFCNGLKVDDKIVVTYSAVLNENADVVEGEDNDAYLSYGDDSSVTTQPDETTTYTCQFQIIKTNSTEKDGKYEVLTDAAFSLYDSETGGNPIGFVKVSGEDDEFEIYRVAIKGDSTDSIITEIPAGTPILKGLAGKTYWLAEVKAPDGYNPLGKRVEVNLGTGNNVANDNAFSSVDSENGILYYYAENSGGVQIKNSKGLLPSTGGMGTVLIYAAGIILIAGAGTALYRMNRKTRDYDQK